MHSRRLWRTAVPVAWLAISCAPARPPRFTTPDLLARANADPVGLYQQLKDQRVVLIGRVSNKALVGRDRTDVSVASYGYFTSASVANRHEVLTVLDLDQDRAVICFFEPSQLDAVAKIPVGQMAAFECKLIGLHEEGGRQRAQFAYCRVAER